MTDFERLLDTLGKHEIKFILVGGAAAIAHGSARLTQDLDIVYERSTENIDRLVAALPADRAASDLSSVVYRAEAAFDVPTLERAAHALEEFLLQTQRNGPNAVMTHD